MDDIHKRADDEAIEKGLSGKALAALHGLHMATNDEAPYDVDESSELDDQETLRDKLIWRTIQIGMRFRAIAIYPIM